MLSYSLMFLPTAFNVTGLTNKEPVIYHGYTLTTKIPFREVIHTINVSLILLILNNTLTCTVHFFFERPITSVAIFFPFFFF